MEFQSNGNKDECSSQANSFPHSEECSLEEETVCCDRNLISNSGECYLEDEIVSYNKNTFATSVDCTQKVKTVAYGENLNVLSEDMVEMRKNCVTSYVSQMTEVLNSSEISEERKFLNILAILRDYIYEMDDLNEVLISTVVELEKETVQRVIQMEARLKSTAKSTMEAVINLRECEEVIRSLVTQRLRIESVLYDIQKQASALKVENNFLRDQNFNLNHDIQALLHIIHRARSTGNWEMDCMMFCEVTPEQVFGPIQSMSPLHCDSGCQTNLKRNSAEELSETKTYSAPVSDFIESINANHFEHMQYSIGYPVKASEMESYDKHVCDEMDTNDEAQISFDHSVRLKTCSLPSLDNLLNYENNLYQSFSSKLSGACEKQDHSLSRLEYVERRRRKNSSPKRKGIQKHSCHKSDSIVQFRQAYSEPLLFMYGDGVYVYKPCETVQKDDMDFHHGDNFMNSIPCQSIDLTLPVQVADNPDISACEWRHTHSPKILDNCAGSFSVICNDESALKLSCNNFEEMSSPDISHGDVQNIIKVNIRPEELFPNYSQLTQSDHASQNNDTATVKANGKERLLVSQYAQTYQTSKCISIGTQTVANDELLNRAMKITENGFAIFDMAEVQGLVETLKLDLLKSQDEVQAKEILMQQLQNHLQTAFKEIEMKDTALENVEKKLDTSRKDKALLENKIADLEKEIDDLSSALENTKALSDSIMLTVESKTGSISELQQEGQVLQNQKRSLMIQLDTKSDELDTAKTEITQMKEKLQQCETEITQQTLIIQNLQEALVKSKRAFDECISKNSPPQTLSKTSYSSNSIVNI